MTSPVPEETTTSRIRRRYRRPASSGRPRSRDVVRFGRRLVLALFALLLADPATSLLPWRGADGRPLPFEREEELLEFLRSAKVVGEDAIPVGVTKPRKLTLRRDGVELDAVFRFKVETLERVFLSDGTFVLSLEDSYRADLAAYELDRLMGLQRIPPMVKRIVGGTPGTVQIWVAGMTELERQRRGMEPPDALLWGQRMADVRVFDNLIANSDRNAGNLIVDSDFRIWWIDHTRSFSRDKRLPRPEGVIQCSHRFLRGLRGLDEAQARARLRPLVGRGSVKALLERRRRLLALIDERVAANGASQVLFAHPDSDGPR